MKSTCVARAHPARHQATWDLIRQWRRTAEHLRVPLLFALDNPGCNDVLVRTAQWQWIHWWCRLHGWLKETLPMHIIDLFKTKKAHFIVEFIFYSIYWTFKYPMNLKTISRSFALINFKASATATFKLAHIKDYMAMPSTWNRTCFPTIRTGRAGHQRKPMSRLSSLRQLKLTSAYRIGPARACLSCLFHTVVEIVTVNVCFWNNRRYAKHHPDGL